MTSTNVTLVLITAVLMPRVVIQLVHLYAHVMLVIVVMVLNVSTLTNAPNSHTVVIQMPNVQIKLVHISVCAITATVEMASIVLTLTNVIWELKLVSLVMNALTQKVVLIPNA